MKFALFALLGATAAVSLVGDDDDRNGKKHGWRNAWPHGIDDSTLDDTVMNWIRKPEDPEPPIKFHAVGQQWQPGHWPINFEWNDDMSHAAWKNEIDDGSDDNEVVDLQTMVEDAGMTFVGN